MNKKSTKTVLNGVLLAAVAAVGVMAYQLITSPLDEEALPDEIQVEMSRQENEKETPLNANTSNVEADLKKVEPENELQEEQSEEENLPTEEDSQEEEQESDENTMVESAVMPEENSEAESEEIAAETALTNVEAVIPPAAYLEFNENTSMEWPVHGNILLDYDMDQTTYFPTLDQYRINPAIAVQATEGTPVVAAVDCAVYEIKEDPRTGTTVTMELGNGYQAVYGQLKDLTVYEGETISRGETIGYIDAPTKYYSEEGSNLYFAMKKNGEPLDPILYLP